MTAPTLSAYPKPVEDLVPAARDLAAQLGTVPSRNRIKKELHVGGPKADAILAELTRTPLPAPPADNEPTPEPTDTRSDPTEPTPPTTADSGPVVNPPPATDDTPPTVDPQPTPVVDPGTNITSRPSRAVVVWPVVLLALPAFVAVWSGWVGLGQMCGFGQVDLLPGFTRDNEQPVATLNTAITLPIGMETYGTYALYVWLSGRLPRRARRFAMWSAITSLGVGAAGQIVYHLLAAADITKAPWPITAAVACLPVAVLGMGAALAHLVRENAR